MIRITGTAGQVLARSNTGVIAARPDDSVLAALEVMARNNVGAVVVLEGMRLVGILSERDYARKVELEGRTARETKVREIMTTGVITVAPDTSIADCNYLMHEHRIRHLPVVEGDGVMGVLSTRDVLEDVVAEGAKQIQELETQQLMVNTGSY